MRIDSLSIRNFRGIVSADFADLSSLIIIAGVNGSGKSSVFDALRLLKSVYGSYAQNEFQQWFGEFQISLTNSPDDLAPLFNDRTLPLVISATFSLAPSERNFLKAHAKELTEAIIARDVQGGDGEWNALRLNSLSRQVRQYSTQVDREIQQGTRALLSELRKPQHKAELTISPDGKPQLAASRVLETAFSADSESEIGSMRYHSANRNYAREQIQNVSVNVVEPSRDRKNQLLYGNAQLTNIKQELASAYVKELVAREAGVGVSEANSISGTLKEMFQLFFPGKEFVGARPKSNGQIYFPVRIGNTSEHDLDDLSSGEKEIVYGYLRMRNSSPTRSVILIDEPELHLNPRLAGELPDFFHKHLGEGLGNQVWLVTHSDALIRRAVRRPYDIFHMSPAYDPKVGATGQATRLSKTTKTDQAVIALVNDLAALRPGAKLVILEGGGSSRFDVTMVTNLFPELADEMNFVSGGSKVSVEALQEALSSYDSASFATTKVLSIVDRDAKSQRTASGDGRFVWNRYHIENYLLEPEFIARLTSVASGVSVTPRQVESQLKNCAHGLVGQLVKRELSNHVNREVIQALDLNIAPHTEEMASQLLEKVVRMGGKLEGLAAKLNAKDALSTREANARAKFANLVEDGRWIDEFPGRDVIKLYFGKHLRGQNYDYGINLLIGYMVDASFRPSGMARVLKKVRAA